MPRLLTDTGDVFQVPAEGCLIGRGAEQDTGGLALIDVGGLPSGRTVSRRHARLRRAEDEWRLEMDGEARNPVWIDDRQVLAGEEVPLLHEARIRLGDVILKFEVDPDAGGALLQGSMTAHQVATAAAEAASAARLETDGAVAAMGLAPLRYVRPFRGMMIDEVVWGDAHEYHRALARLHVLSAHGWGIIEGLAVLAEPTEPGTITVRPGAAVDALGRVIIVSQAIRIQAPSAIPASGLYVVLRWREEPAEPQSALAGPDESTRMMEGGRITLDRRTPAPPAIELARIAPGDRIANAADAFSPGAGEIDVRFRVWLPARAPQPIPVAQLILPGAGTLDKVAERHQAGLRYLIREITRTSSYRARWVGTVSLGGTLPPISLLYLSGEEGFSLDSKAEDQLSTFFSTGGVLLAEGCEGQRGREFNAAVQHLASGLARRPAALARDHPLLLAHHVFGEGPDGIAEDDGFIVSDANLGCLWQGGEQEAPATREQIRTALEFGVNIALYGMRRQRPLEVAGLGP